ncbi:hypothetical protein TNIN_104521 [Trichonephila inaurata madagascariensis]|uniref:Uncharacterized protein n=1 Tax=Trichonephila inaurata madagascariensis TaxID=2747483 RepID=A0A8X6M883_9ARAC|nr:hypothetical protein TNIN_104521 [Trichonephila inaurata madagascariensis]
MGEIVDPGMNVKDLKQNLMQSQGYLDDEEFDKDFFDTTIEERMEEEKCRKRKEEMEKYRKEIKELRKRAEERRLERIQELEFMRIEARWKKENETRIREASHKVRLKAEEEAKAVEERQKIEEE